MANNEAVCENLLQTSCEPDTMGLTSRNLEQIDRELAEIERKLLPLLNAIRAIRGERPVFVPKG